MNLIIELASGPYLQKVAEKLIEMEIDINEVVQTTAVKALGEIKEVIADETMNEIDKVECIVSIFEKYNIDTNGCCDY